MFVLRDYQEEAVQLGVSFLLDKSKKNANKKGIIVCPTGGGKSLVIANIAQRIDGRVIIFQPTKELLEQNFAKYISYGNYAEIYSASKGRKKISQVTFATIGSVVNKPQLFSDFQYCIIDECDLVSPSDSTMYQKFLSKLDMRVIGLTATPIRMKRYNFPNAHSKLCMLDRMNPRYFNHYIHITQIQEMVSRGFFMAPKYISFSFDESLLSVNTTGGDYTEQSIDASFVHNDILGNIERVVRGIIQKGIIMHVLIFVESIGHAEQMQQILGDSICGVVSSRTKKKEREDILKAFKSGKLLCVVNCGVLVCGFDFPELDCIILGRPTFSLRLHYQIIGRGVRPHKTKERLYVIDFVNNVKRLGMIEQLQFVRDGRSWAIHNGKRILTNVDITQNGEEDGKGREEPEWGIRGRSWR